MYNININTIIFQQNWVVFVTRTTTVNWLNTVSALIMYVLVFPSLPHPLMVEYVNSVSY